MARIARVVVPDFPHHVTQRGNRRQATFFVAADYQDYKLKIAEAKKTAGVDIWAYCLMPNHVHFVAVPRDSNSLSRLFAESHRRYTRRINFRYGWQGHLWQERFHSCVLSESHLLATVRYVERNPVRAGLCRSPEDWPWSSARAHLARSDDKLVSVAPMLELVGNWRSYIETDESPKEIEALRQHTRTGRPLGDGRFVESLERITGRELQRKKPGPKPRN